MRTARSSDRTTLLNERVNARAGAAECETLPSATSAYRLVHGDAWAIPFLVRDWFVRGLIMALGIRIFGVPAGNALKFGLAGSASVEAAVLGYALVTKKETLTA